MRILVIGGTRFIGPRVVTRLVASGHSVTVFHRGRNQATLPSSVVAITSAQAAMPVREIPDEIRATEPEVVVHMIAMGEEDTEAAVRAFQGSARRIVVPSSGDVYKAYGIFKALEPGLPVPVPLSEDSPLRATRYPYRTPDTPADALEHYYDKILVEEVLNAQSVLPATILRLPKVYGPDNNSDLATVYGFRRYPDWRWTHGFVDNVAAAIALAAVDNRASGRTYNVGEAVTPTVAERLSYLPPRPEAPLFEGTVNPQQNLSYNTTRIRNELGYEEPVNERHAMLSVVTGDCVL